jgi:hypothetical protein
MCYGARILNNRPTDVVKQQNTTNYVTKMSGFYIQIIGNFIGFEKMTQIVSGDFEKIMTDSENNQ